MAWKFVNAKDTEGRARRQSVLDQITRWWGAFVQKLPDIESDLNGGAGPAPPPERVTRVMQISSKELREWMDEQVARIDPRLRWEFGNDANGGRCLVITPGKFLRLRPMAQSVLARAPQAPGWTFYGHRPPLQALDAVDAVRLRTGHAVVAPTALARIGSHNRIDLIFKLKLARTDPSAALVVADALAEAVLGEEASDKWVGEIEVEELTRGPVPDQYLGMSQLRATMVGLTQTMASHLPAQPYHVGPPPSRWNTLKFAPRPEADYPRQDDLSIGRTIVPKVRAAAFGEGPSRPPSLPFYSSNFSRHGETFCYLKIDVPGASLEQRRRRKYDLEEKIDPALRKAGIGCIVGSSTGLRYIYFDLAITDLNKTMAVLGPVLLSKDLPERSWLLFYDTEWADEYVGLRSTTGAPPEASAEAPAAAIELSRQAASRPAAPPPPPKAEKLTDLELFPDDLLS